MTVPDTPLPQETPAGSREAAIALGQTMKQLHRYISSHVMQGLQAELTDLDLSFSQMTALHQLRATPGLTVTELSARTHLSLPAASHLVERLVQRGLADRQENPDNRREKRLSLSARGQAVLAGMDSAFVNAYIRTFAQLSPQSLQAAHDSLAALLTDLEAQHPAPCPDPQETP